MLNKFTGYCEAEKEDTFAEDYMQKQLTHTCAATLPLFNAVEKSCNSDSLCNVAATCSGGAAGNLRNATAKRLGSYKVKDTVVVVHAKGTDIAEVAFLDPNL